MGFIIGMFVGGAVGFLVAGLMNAAHDGDLLSPEQVERMLGDVLARERQAMYTAGGRDEAITYLVETLNTLKRYANDYTQPTLGQGTIQARDVISFVDRELAKFRKEFTDKRSES